MLLIQAYDVSAVFALILLKPYPFLTLTKLAFNQYALGVVFMALLFFKFELDFVFYCRSRLYDNGISLPARLSSIFSIWLRLRRRY